MDVWRCRALCVFQKSMQSWAALRSSWRRCYRLADTNTWNRCESRTRAEVSGVTWSHVTSSSGGSSSWAQCPVFSCTNTSAQTQRGLSHNNICPFSDAHQKKRKQQKITHTVMRLDRKNIQSTIISITCIRWNTNRKSAVDVINVLVLVCSSVYYVRELLSGNKVFS